jgi:hypothetical protein
MERGESPYNKASNVFLEGEKGGGGNKQINKEKPNGFSCSQSIQGFENTPNRDDHLY